MSCTDDGMSLRQIAEGYASNASNVMIACVDKEQVKAFFSDWEWINLGLTVSEQLCKIPKEQRKQAIADIVINAIHNTSSKNIVVDNIDLLFSPEYSLDVLRLFTMAGRNKRLIIIWDGDYKDGVLTYAQPGCRDFHSYEVKRYGVSCITK